MFLFPLFYVIREFHSFLHRGKASECTCEAMLDSSNFPDETFAEGFVLALFQSLVNFAVGYKYTK